MSDQPIACSLPTDQARDRSAVIAALRADAMLEQQPINGGLRTRFRDQPDIEQRVRDLVAAERVCCSFMRFDVRRDEDAIVLDITGSQDAQPVIAQFLAEPAAA
jgi:hypothetical protein